MNNFVYEKYQEFYEKNGYITTEITDIAPCVTTQCGSTTSSGTVLIIESEGNKNG